MNKHGIMLVNTYPGDIQDKPFVDEDGDLWIDNILIYIANCNFTAVQIELIKSGDYAKDLRLPTEEEKKLYWRYRKAWELMNR